MASKDWETYFTSLKKQDWESAKNALLRLSKEDKNNPQIHLKTGDVYQRIGDTPNAIASYLLAGRILEHNGFAHKALAAFKIILRLDPDNRSIIARAQKIMDELDAEKHKRVKPPVLVQESPVADAEKKVAAPAEKPPIPSPAPSPPEPPPQPSARFESTTLSEEAPAQVEKPAVSLPQDMSSKEEAISESAEEAPANDEEWLKSAYDAIDQSVSKGKVDAGQGEEDITPQSLEEELSDEVPSDMQDLIRPLSDRPGMPAKPDIFSTVPDDMFGRFVRELETRTFPHGKVVIDEGDSGDTMYLIRSGKARVVAHLFGREIELAILTEGDLFGEVGFLTGRPRTASVIAEGDLDVFEINRPAVEMVLEMNPEVLGKLEEFYECRVMSTIQKVKS